MAINLTFDSAYEKCSSAGYQAKELTYGSNGYPEFGGHKRWAFYGFGNYEQAEELAKEVAGSIERIHWRDGWQLAESKGSEYGPMKLNADWYGDDYRAFDPENELDGLKALIEGADSFETIKTIVSEYDILQGDYESKDDDEIILLNCGNYYDTIKSPTMEWSYDTHNLVIAVVINSDTYKDIE